MKKNSLLDDMLFEFRSELEENPFSLSSLKWFAFGWILFLTMKIRSFSVKFRCREHRGMV